MNKYTLDNGITVFCQKESHVQSINLGVFIQSGSVFENEENNGVSHFIEHLIFKTGNKQKSYSEILSELGVKYGGFTAKEYTCYYFRFTSFNFKTIIGTLIDIFRSFEYINEEQFSIEKNIIRSELQMYQNNFKEVNQSRSIELSFPNQSLSYEIVGTDESLDNLNLEYLIEYYNSVYLPENMILSVCGNLNQEQEEYIMDKFNKLQRHHNGDNLTEINYPNFTYVGGYDVIERDTEHLVIDINYYMKNPSEKEFYSIYLLNSILGYGTRISRLQKYIREYLGISYNVFSYPTIYKKNSLLSIHAEINSHSAIKFFDVIHTIINDLKNDYVVEDEMVHAISNYHTSLILGLESPMDKMFYYGKNAVLNRNIYTIEESIELMRSVSVKDIKEIALSFFTSTPSLAISGKCSSDEVKEYYKYLLFK
jgi:predicted Zn-dependent peptidase